MPNPFSWFRKNQKLFLVVITFMCIVGFVLFEPLYRIFVGGGAAGENRVVVRTNFGDLRESEIQGMIQSRALLNRFLEAVTMQAAFNIAQTGQMPMPPEQLQNFLLQQMERTGVYAPRMANEEGVVRWMLLSRQARQLGMNISDETALEWLQRSTGEQVTPDELRRVVNQLRTSQRRIFDELRTALAVKNLQEAIGRIDSIQGAPPGLRWEYFQRLHREIQAELIALPVADFVDSVGEPTEVALRELFEKHKNMYAFPGEPEPGFHVPAKGQFQGFKADYEQFAAGVEVTDEEIAEYYENNQEQFPYSGIDPAESDAVETEAADTTATDTTTTETDPDAVSTEGEATEDQAPPADEPVTDDPATEEAATETAPEANEADSPNPGGGGDDAGGATPSDEPAAADDAGPDLPSAGAEEPAPTQEPAADPDDTVPAPADAPLPTDPQDDMPDAVDAELPSDIGIGEEPQYDPLWKVSDEIRRMLTRQRVTDKINEVFDSLAAAMDQYAQRLELYEIELEEFEDRKAGEEPQPPAALDLRALSQEYGVESFETGLITPFEADALEIGRTSVDNRPFRAVAFDSMGIYSTRRAEDIEGNRYLFWKIASTRDQVPTFQEARDDVVAAWKLIEARRLALKRAQQMADAANESGESLQQKFAGDSQHAVTETGFFSWMTEQALAPQFGTPRVQLSSVAEVPNAGQDFMRAAFSLPPGRAGAALDAPESTAYVIRVVEQRPPLDEMFSQFAGTPYSQYYMVAQFDLRDFTTEWVRDLEEQAGLVWERPPRMEIQR